MLDSSPLNLSSSAKTSIALFSMSTFPALPKVSFDGDVLPDLSHATNIGPAPAPAPVAPEFDFSIKKSPVFGGQGGNDFSQGAEVYAPRAVHFTLSATGLKNIATYSSVQDSEEKSQGTTHKLQLDQGEYIKGISGRFHLHLSRHMLDAYPSLP